MKKFSPIILLTIFLGSCSTIQTPEKPVVMNSVQHAHPAIIIYKTRADYSNLVPVNLNPEKTEVISFPAPSDIRSRLNNIRPEPLGKGYLLDHRGINAQSAYIQLTWEEYAELNHSPSPEALFKLLIDKNPFISMYHCGNGTLTPEELNKVRKKIEAKDHSGWKQLILQK